MSIASNIIGTSSQSDELFFYSTINGVLQVFINTSNKITPINFTDLKTNNDLKNIAYFKVSQQSNGLWVFKIGNLYFDGNIMRNVPTEFDVNYSHNVNNGQLLYLGLSLTLTAIINGKPREGTPLPITLGGKHLYTTTGGRCLAPYSPYEFLQKINNGSTDVFYTDSKLCNAGMNVTYCVNPLGCGDIINEKNCYAPCGYGQFCTNEGSMDFVNPYMSCNSSMREAINGSFTNWSFYMWLAIIGIFIILCFLIALNKTINKK